MSNYETGFENNDIWIEVKVGTPGIASTGVYLVSDDEQQKKIAESNLQNGNISRTLVGKAGTVKGNYLLIMTLVDLGHLDPANWPAALATLSVIYEMSGGQSGTRDEKYDPGDVETSENGKIISVSHEINLV